MSMENRVIKKERRRQTIIQKRKKKYRRIMQRNIILAAGFIIVLLLGKRVVSLVGHAHQKAAVETVTGQNSNKVAEETNASSLTTREMSDGNTVDLTQEALSKGNLVLVNDENPIHNYSEASLVTIGSYMSGICQVKSTELKLTEEAASALREMLQDFNDQQKVHDLSIISCYRDFNAQEALHYQSVVNHTSQEETTFVAKPDRSEHHTGLAIDLGLCYRDGTSGDYDGEGIYSWINENCYKYGFIVRYDERKKEMTGIGYEPWHLRYVGKVHAQIMQELDLCLEEYEALVKNYRYYTNPGQGITDDMQGYSIYFVPCEGEITHIPVPRDKAYTISGNNQDGFIVTVQLQASKK